MKKIIPLLILFITFLGCGTNNVKISGTVTFSDDGSPVTAGEVWFDDGIRTARGIIQEDGTFVMGFERENNGVPRGTYQVSIVRAIKLLPNPDDIYPTPSEELIDEKYSDKNTSGLSIVVDGSQQYNITVDRAKNKTD
jgi:hypothetical protein